MSLTRPPRAGRGREEADPDRLHRRQLRQLPADGTERSCPGPRSSTLLKQFVTVQLYTDFVPIASLTADQRRKLAEKNQERQLDLGPGGDEPVLRGPHARRQARGLAWGATTSLPSSSTS